MFLAQNGCPPLTSTADSSSSKTAHQDYSSFLAALPSASSCLGKRRLGPCLIRHARGAGNKRRQRGPLMRRIAGSNFGRCEPPSDGREDACRRRGGAAMSPEPKVGRSPLRYRAGFRPPVRAAQSTSWMLRRPAKYEPAWQVVDDLPEMVPVMQREIEVIETYLAALLDESSEPIETETKSRQMNTGKRGKN